MKVGRRKRERRRQKGKHSQDLPFEKSFIFFLFHLLPSSFFNHFLFLSFKEWWGYTEFLKHQAQKIAHQGYLAIVPDLYKGKHTLDEAEARHLMEDFNFGQGIGELGTIIKSLRAHHPDRKVGITGFCLGGALTLATAVAAESKPNAVAPFYGIPDGRYFDLTKITVPVLGHFGDKDSHTGFSDVAAAKGLEEKLKTAGVEHNIVSVPNQGHGYMNENDWYTEYRVTKNLPPFDAKVVGESYNRLFAFFDKHLKH